LKNILIFILSLTLLIGCQATSKTKEEPKETEKMGKEFDLKVGAVIEKTLRDIHNDLKNIKSEFPQLSDIDNATIENGRFGYQKGFLKDSKIEGPSYEKDGCDIMVEIKYPFTPEDERQSKGSPLMKLKNGKSLKSWRLVRAEQNEQGKLFIEKIGVIIYSRLEEMANELKMNFVDKLTNDARLLFKKLNKRMTLNKVIEILGDSYIKETGIFGEYSDVVLHILHYEFPDGLRIVISAFDENSPIWSGTLIDLKKRKIIETLAFVPRETGVEINYRDVCLKVAKDIELLKNKFPQLKNFSASKNFEADRWVIVYQYHTHKATHRGGWTSGVPNPDPDGIWFYIGLWDEKDPGAAGAQINTQPAIPTCYIGDRRVTFLILEGEKTIPVNGEIFKILRVNGLQRDIGDRE